MAFKIINITHAYRIVVGKTSEVNKSMGAKLKLTKNFPNSAKTVKETVKQNYGSLPPNFYSKNFIIQYVCSYRAPKSARGSTFISVKRHYSREIVESYFTVINS